MDNNNSKSFTEVKLIWYNIAIRHGEVWICPLQVLYFHDFVRNKFLAIKHDRERHFFFFFFFLTYKDPLYAMEYLILQLQNSADHYCLVQMENYVCENHNSSNMILCHRLKNIVEDMQVCSIFWAKEIIPHMCLKIYTDPYY